MMSSAETTLFPDKMVQTITVSVCGAETDVAASTEQRSCIQFYIAIVSGRAVVILILPGL